MEHLRREGLILRARLVGDVMVDALLLSVPHAEWRPWLVGQRSDGYAASEQLAGEYALLTVHRAGNTDDPERLGRIMEGVALLELPVIFPAHPRVAKAIAGAGLRVPSNVWLCEPAPYFAMLGLQRDARVVLTDSGGVQKEAYVLGVPCVTLRVETEWPETLEGGWNVLVDVAPRAIAAAAHRPRPAGDRASPFGDGHAADAIVTALEQAGARQQPTEGRP
jgi:UDP-N-acetylglucosamine 2-epimerase